MISSNTFFFSDTDSRVQIVSNISRFCRIRIWIQVEKKLEIKFIYIHLISKLKSNTNTNINISILNEDKYE